MRKFFDFIWWLIFDEPRYVRICNVCGFIHYDDDENTLCCICQENTTIVPEARARQWKNDMRVEKAIKAMEA